MPKKKLSVREQQVLQLVALGYTNFQIAKKLTIAENTVKAHMQNIFAKLEVQSRTQAALYATQRGWVTGIA
ncbi:MAG: response regulator transcription factor [Anaerolineae bacterium]|nr:response regulator transcription factor [Anaerolineae bacterium]